MTTKLYEGAREEALAYRDYAPEAVEELMAIGYRAGLSDATKEFYDSFHAEQGNPKQILIVFHDKLAALARKFESRAKELKV